MAYRVFGGTLNLAQSINHCCILYIYIYICFAFKTVYQWSSFSVCSQMSVHYSLLLYQCTAITVSMQLLTHEEIFVMVWMCRQFI